MLHKIKKKHIHQFVKKSLGDLDQLMNADLTAEETLAMADMIATAAVMAVATEIDGDPFTRNWMEQTNYYLNIISYIMQKI